MYLRFNECGGRQAKKQSKLPKKREPDFKLL